MKKLATKLIKWYQKKISPTKSHKCRHKPTCSNYALEAYERHNFLYASYLSTKRILSCNPLFKPKYDPVPKRKIQRRLVKTHKIYSKILKEEKLIDIYLPKGRKKYYPVIYMTDGDKLFSKDNDSWNLMEIVTKLIKEKEIPPIIIVGIHENQNRLSEYSPIDNSFILNGEANFYGDKYIKFITDELKPFIDYNFNTLSDLNNTFIAGSSMGGLISLYAGINNPDTFKGIGVLSPSIWWNRDGFLNTFKKDYNLSNQRYFVTCGTLETPDKINNELFVKDSIKINELLNKNKAETFHQVYDGMKHEPYFWSSLFKDLILFLTK
ncbi:MAG: membrane protein insertion efficiency factor YidD [Acholeplasmataceae bacterium]